MRSTTGQDSFASLFMRNWALDQCWSLKAQEGDEFNDKGAELLSTVNLDKLKGEIDRLQRRIA
eukprot:8081748-Pyramimonas_sp.AAC.1